MTVETVRRVDQITPITFTTDARAVALGVYDRLFSLLEQLDADDWSVQTECPAWNVADMVGHLIGAARANASFVELVRQQAWALRHKREFDGNDLDAMNALQVRNHAALTPAERIATLRALSVKAVNGRLRLPRVLRSIRAPLAQDGSTASGMPTSVTLGELMAVVYTRDTWLHRVDIARATGHPLELDPEVDGRIVEDVVVAWAARHGRPFRLVLTGPAGGTFTQGEGGPELELDAIELCRILSGRAPGEGLLATRVLF
jgi:uncharacterized protein (TIGR03083 family)